MYLSSIRSAALIAALGLVAPTLVQGQAPSTREMSGRAVRAAKAPVIDGRGDDEVWKTAPPLTDFRQFDPGEDIDPTFRTEARIAYDDRYLYVLVRAFDPHPDSIRSLLSRRDVKTSSDQLKIIIDAFHDRRTGVGMAVNPAGVKRDHAIYNDNTEDLTWDGVWDAETRIDELGWVAEFRVPFSQLRFNPKEVNEFGFGVWRDIARLNQRDAWPVYRRSQNSLISQLGTITGISGIGSARRLELLPYAVAKNEPDPSSTTFGTRNKLTAGLDVKAGLTPAITLDASVNPDFGQVEADPSVLNLSAFEIRFDERRPFFQEGAGLYRCSGPCEGTFYSRRIGRTPQLRASSSDPVFTNILGAAKLTGRYSNGVAFGVVDAVTERVRGTTGNTIEPQSNYFVGRALREWNGGRAQLGVQLTNVVRQLDAQTEPLLRRAATNAVVQGYFDFARDVWRVTAYSGFNRVEGSARAIALTQLNSVHYFQRPDHEARYDSTRTTMGGVVGGANLTKRRGSLRSDTFVRWAGTGLELNDFGLVNLMNDVQVKEDLDFQQLGPNRFFRSSFTRLSAETHWTTGGLPTARSVSVHASASLANSWGGAITWSATDLGGVNCVSCARGGPALTQSPKHGIRFDISGDPRPQWVPKTALRLGTSDNGRSWYRGADLGTDVRVASQFSASLYTSFDHVVNDQQWVANFGKLLSDTTHYAFARLGQDILAITARANWTATPTLSFQLYAQPFVASGSYSDAKELKSPRAPTYAERFRSSTLVTPSTLNFNVKQFNSNAVVRWEYRPASTLFVVWQQGRSDGRDAGSVDASRDVGHLFGTHPYNTVLVKLSWWFNP